MRGALSKRQNFGIRRCILNCHCVVAKPGQILYRQSCYDLAHVHVCLIAVSVCVNKAEDRCTFAFCVALKTNILPSYKRTIHVISNEPTTGSGIVTTSRPVGVEYVPVESIFNGETHETA